MPNEGRLKIGSSFLKIGSNYLRIGPAPGGGATDIYLLACTSASASNQYLLKYSAGAWSLVANGTNLLPLTGGIGGIDAAPSGGLASALGSSLWASGYGNVDANAWRSNDGGATWALKLTQAPGDLQHGIPIARDAAGNLWAARRNGAGTFEVLKSTDNGDSWSVSMSTGTSYLYHVACHRSNANVIAVAGMVESGADMEVVVWVTTNGGSSWAINDLDDSAEPFTDSTCLLFDSDGNLHFACMVLFAPNTDHLTIYSAPSPYSSFTREDLLTASPDIVFDGPFMASSGNPLFAGINWNGNPPDALIHGRVFRRAAGSWAELAEPFAAGISLFGLLYHAGSDTLYAIGCAAVGGTGPAALKIAKASPAGTGSVTWTDITAAVNAAAGATLAVLGASALFEVAA